jgi:hypothetical protein
MSARKFNRTAARRSVTGLVIALVAFILAGCGGVEGVYEMSEKDPAGETVTMSLELKGDKTATFAMRGSDPDSMSLTRSGTYTVDGDKITISIDGDAQVFTLSGDKLSANFMGENVVLVKK